MYQAVYNMYNKTDVCVKIVCFIFPLQEEVHNLKIATRILKKQKNNS